MESNLQKQIDSEIVELEGVKIRRDQIELIKRTIFIGATDDEMRLFFYECRRRGIHPMDRLIFPVKRAGKVAFQMGIDYLRAAAEETGRYVGQRPINYGPPSKQSYQDKEITVPEWAEVIVLRKDPETGEVTEIPHRAYWKEYYPGDDIGFMWRKMPMNQLGKCAEAGALRKAFPRKLGGLYINEEMEQAEAVPFAPLQQPQKKNGEPPKGETLKLTSPIVNVTEKDGKKTDGKPYTLYTITGNIEGQEIAFKTFSKTIGQQAKNDKGSEAQFEFEYVKGQYGNDLISISPVIDADAQ